VNIDIESPPCCDLLKLRIPNGHRDMTRLRVVQRRELLNASPTDLIDHALAEAPVQVAHELGIRLGQLAERAVEELDTCGALRGAVTGLDGRLEAQPAQLGFERVQATP
jgi:hypothetical protein